MAYSTSADVQVACGGPAKLLQLADKDGDGVADTGVVDAAIVEADGLIDSYAHKRFAVPFAAPSPIVKALSARLAAWNLRRGKPGTTITKEEIELHDIDLKWLEDLSKGLVSPGVEPSPTKSELIVDTAGQRDTVKEISREKLKGFW